jgi:hypothetical protein
MADKEIIDCELNLDFLNEVRDSLKGNELTKNIPIMPRNEDASLYTANEEEPYLLSFSNLSHAENRK